MPAWLIPAIAGGASLLGSVLQNKAQAKQAQKQMDFQEKMSSTAYQRATADMKMSGINPMLAYAQGGASTPGGAQADMSDVLGPAVSSAMHARRMRSELQLMDMQKERVDAEVDLVNRQEKVARWEEALKKAQSLETEQRTENERIMAAHSAAELFRTLNRAALEKTPFGKGLNWVQMFREAVFGGSMVPRVFRR